MCAIDSFVLQTLDSIKIKVLIMIMINYFLHALLIYMKIFYFILFSHSLNFLSAIETMKMRMRKKQGSYSVQFWQYIFYRFHYHIVLKKLSENTKIREKLNIFIRAYLTKNDWRHSITLLESARFAKKRSSWKRTVVEEARAAGKESYRP